MDCIKKRLDELQKELENTELSVGGYTYTSKIVDGWKVYTSSSGFIIAIIEMDKVGCQWNELPGILGFSTLIGGISENLPSNIFTIPPTIKMNAYCDNNFGLVLSDILPPSTAYTGTTDIYLVDKDNQGKPSYPTTFHYIITAIGF